MVFKHCHVQTLAAKVQRSMVAEVSLFQVAEVPTNMYDYTLPKLLGFVSERKTVSALITRILK